MCIQSDDETLDTYDWALVSLFEVLGIKMDVDCERDMREMFVWWKSIDYFN